MPELIKLADGSEREVLTADEQKALNEKAAKVDTVEQTHNEALKNLRTHTKNLEKQLKDKGVDVKPMDGETLTPEEILEKSRQQSEQLIQDAESKKLEKHRTDLLNKLSGGDENKKKVIEEKYNRMTGGKAITDKDEMSDLMSDAALLANKNMNAGSGSILHKGAGEPTGAPIRGNNQTRARGAEIASGFGYQIKNKDLTK